MWTGHVWFEVRGQLVLLAALGAHVRSAVWMGHFVGEQFGTILKDFVARRALVFGQVSRPVSLVGVAWLDDFTTQLAREQRTGLVLLCIVFGHLLHGPFDYLVAQLAGPGLIVSAPKEERVYPPIISFLYKLLQLVNFFRLENSSNLLLKIF